MINEQYNMPILLDVVSNDVAKIADKLVTAQNTLTVLQYKAWVVFLSSLSSNDDDGNNTYQFNVMDIADRMALDSRKARGTMVAKIFETLSEKQIKYLSEPNEKGEQNLFSAILVSSVVYRRDTHTIQLEIPKVIRPFLFALKQGAFLSVDTKDITALDTVYSIRIYIFLKNLERKGIFIVPLEDFKKGINATSKSFRSFSEFKRTVIKPAVKEIRRHTHYKDFFIEDNARIGVKATHIRFGFEKTIDIEDDIFADVSPNRAAICRKFPEDVQIVMRLAINHGFDPLYVEDKLDDVPGERIIANFRYVIKEIINKDKKRGIDKGKDVYGKYFLTAVKEAWAEKNNKTDEMLLSNARAKENQVIQEQVKLAQEQEELANEAFYLDNAAKTYLKKITNSGFDLEKFIEDNKTALIAMAGKHEFNKVHAMSGKKTYREYKILVRLISAKIMTNEIEIPKQNNLFS